MTHQTWTRLRILLTDDASQWRDELTGLLAQNGIVADSATSAVEARALIEERCYHLVVLDINLDDDDPKNEDGLDLLRELCDRGLNAVFKVIMLTANGTAARMRDAFTKQQVGDFIDKGEFSGSEFVQRVQELTSELDFRDDLAIHWQPADVATLVVADLVLGGTRIVREDAAQISRTTSELEDLLCRLFHNASSLIVHRLAPGFSGAPVLWVQPFVKDGGARPVIVKFGEYSKIEEERRNYDTFLQPFLGGRSTTILERQRTVHLGGNVYSLLDAADDRVRDFDQFYQDATPVQIRRVLEGLFFDTCREWYGNLGPLTPCDLTEEYQRSLNFTEERLARVVEEQLSGVEVTASTVTFRALTNGRIFTHPLVRMADQHIVRPTYRCITHGDLNQRNILVDKTDRAWLIDFARTGKSHFLRDVVLLDSVVRFELLAANAASLEERLELEELLITTRGQSVRKRLKAGARLSNPHVAKAFNVTVHLRSLAKQLGPKRLRSDRTGYAEGLFYTSVNALKFHQMPMVQREHALLCASLMADHLS